MVNIKTIQAVYASRGFTVNAALIINEATSRRPTALTEITDGNMVKLSVIELETLRVHEIGTSICNEVDSVLADITMGPVIILAAKDNSIRKVFTATNTSTVMLLVKQDDDGFYRLCKKRRVDLGKSKLTDYLDISSFSVSEDELEKRIKEMSSKETSARDYENRWVSQTTNYSTIIDKAMKVWLTGCRGSTRLSFAILASTLKDVPYNNIVSVLQNTSAGLIQVRKGGVQRTLEEAVHSANASEWYRMDLVLLDSVMTIHFVNFCSSIRFDFQDRAVTVDLDAMTTDFRAGNLSDLTLTAIAMVVLVACKLRLKHPGKKRSTTQHYQTVTNVDVEFGHHKHMISEPYGNNLKPEDRTLYEHCVTPIIRLFCNHEYFVLTYIDEKYLKPRYVAFHKQTLIEFIEGTPITKYDPFSHYTAGDMVSRVFDFLRNMNTSDFNQLVPTSSTTHQVNKILTKINRESAVLHHMLKLTMENI